MSQSIYIHTYTCILHSAIKYSYKICYLRDLRNQIIVLIYLGVPNSEKQHIVATFLTKTQLHSKLNNNITLNYNILQNRLDII